MADLRLFAFAASHRPASLNKQLLACALAHVPINIALDHEEDYGAFDLPPYNQQAFEDNTVPPAAQAVAARIAAADALLIATPEYNWSMPGSLKNIIDWVSHIAPNPFAGKTALLLSATPSQRGGTVGLTQLRVPLEVLGVWVYPQIIAIGNADTAYADNRLCAPKDHAFLETVMQDFLAKSTHMRKG